MEVLCCKHQITVNILYVRDSAIASQAFSPFKPSQPIAAKSSDKNQMHSALPVLKLFLVIMV